MKRSDYRLYLQEWREALGINQDVIAQKIGRTASYISKLEARTGDVKLDRLLEFSAAINIPWKMLLSNPPDELSPFFHSLDDQQKASFLRILNALPG